jgi:tetratricopeptide (TPR) repeat protein
MARLTASLAVGLAACEPVETPAASVRALPVAAPPLAGPQAEARALALAVPEDDRSLQAKADAARKLGHKPEVWVELGQAWVQRARRSGDPGFHLNADACATVALALAPEFRPALDLRLLVLNNGHRFAEARDAAREILTRDPDDTLALGALSDALLETGALAEAEVAVQRMVDLKPDLPAFSRISYLRWLRGDVEGATEAIRHAYDAGRGSRDPEPAAWTLVQAALIFWHKGDFEGALAGLDLSDALLDDYAPSLQLRGRALLSLDRAAEAVGPLRRAQEISPLPETAWLLADALRGTGDAAGAEAADTRAVTLGRQMDKRTLAQHLAARNRDIPAAVVAARAEAAERGGPYIDDALAFALYRTGRPEDLAEARRLIERATSGGLPDARVMFHAGAILLAAGEPEAGRRWLEKALKTNPAFDADGVAEARRLLEARR